MDKLLIVGFSNKTRNDNSTSKTCLTSDINRVAKRECPPSSKKLSSKPTLLTFKMFAQIPANISSVAVFGVV